MKRLFTSESVTEGHPDKICDQVADAILDEIMANDPEAHVACEAFCTTGLMIIMGEITTSCYVNAEALARQTILDIGYDDPAMGFNGYSCGVLLSIHEQSRDIAMGVDCSLESKGGDSDIASLIGAGDQGIMFGYACDETPELMPLAHVLSNRLTMRLAHLRKSGEISYLRPDGKSQVTVEYDEQGVPCRVDSVVVSTQHKDDVDMDRLRPDIMEKVIRETIPSELLDDDTKYYINPTGRFVIGGPEGDTGLTGRKIIADTYGGAARHGGGSFSGKDPTKVDRSGAYALRHVAKNIVAAGLASRCEVQAAYAIGVARPVSISVDTFSTGTYPDEVIAGAVSEVFDLRPYSIIRDLKLRRPIYRKTAAYGHFGREDADFSWEKIDKVSQLREALINI